jgi:hypothetical protein
MYSAPCAASQKAALSAEDSTLIVHGGAESTGGKAIEQFFQAADKSKKPGIRIVIISPRSRSTQMDRMKLLPRLTLLLWENSFLDHWGIYHDTLIQVNGEWLFKVRKVTIEGADPRGWTGSEKGPVKFEPVD